MYRNFPVLDSEPVLMAAQRYNRARLALLWLENPARLDLAGMHDLELILTDSAWLCIDTGLGNLPVMAWREFRRERRLALHEPVLCRIDYYTMHAGRMRDGVLEVMDRLLMARLQRRKNGRPGEVRPIRGADRRQRSR